MLFITSAPFIAVLWPPELNILVIPDIEINFSSSIIISDTSSIAL
ncbi:uncharacterized protein METZ01_LOCUS119153 [marine metagenome]|uniref:Uncharacterized protein n=1 Tax=marine metagenome TaxID=408172 RepID=A0A381XNH2_9ZZZZ